MTVCAQCGRENPRGFKFCGNCGAPLGAPAEPAGEVRKAVTVLFCDVTGSTALGERLDPEALRRVMSRYFDELSAVTERHGGTVEKFAGDSVMAIFGVPQVREDDALRAVRAAAEIRDRIPAVGAELGIDLQFRTGVNTGEVVVGSDQSLATGDAVNVAARLEQAAAPGEILIGAETRRLVRDAAEVEALEPLTLKGKAAPVEAYRLVAVDPDAPAFARRLDAPLVGRERELRSLRGAYESAVGERACHVFTLLGAAGVGKSRLAAEFVGGVEREAAVVSGRCLHYGEGITFFPLVEVLMQLGERATVVLDRVVTGGASSANELFFEVRKLLETVAAERPLVVVLDDLQWAEPMLLDLLDHITDLSRGAPILLLCLARPELLEVRPGWGGGRLHATTVLLEPLAAAECEELLAGLGDDLDPEVRSRAVEASEGNPLFLEEIVALVREGGEVGVPPTIQALLSARLEQLDGDERAVMGRGAVEGKVFHRGAVRELAPEPVRPEVESHLAALVRKELIRPDEPMVAGEDAFRFRHLLIRDAAYEALPKRARAELHERFADWLEREGADLVELDEIAGWHLEQAVRYCREVGLDVDPRLAERASERPAAAGRHARQRMDVRAAASLLPRALELTPAGDVRRPPLALSLAEVTLRAGRFEDMETLLAEADSEPSLRPAAMIVRLDWLVLVRPDEFVELAAAELPKLVERFEGEGDELGLAKAHFMFMRLHQLHTAHGDTVAAAFEAAEHARRAGERAIVVEALAIASIGITYGPDVAEDTRRKLGEIESAETAPYVVAFTLIARSILAANDGRFDEARDLNRRGVELLAELGTTIYRWAVAQTTGRVAVAEGRYGDAIRVLREAWDELGKLGERSFRSTNGALLADALYRDGQIEEANRMAHAAEAEGGVEDFVNFAIARRVLAQIYADRGQLEEADEAARSAMEYAFRMDIPMYRAEALVGHAHVHRTAGRPAEAAEALEQAIEIYEHKGDRVGAARTRELLAEPP